MCFYGGGRQGKGDYLGRNECAQQHLYSSTSHEKVVLCERAACRSIEEKHLFESLKQPHLFQDSQECLSSFFLAVTANICENPLSFIFCSLLPQKVSIHKIASLMSPFNPLLIHSQIKNGAQIFGSPLSTQSQSPEPPRQTGIGNVFPKSEKEAPHSFKRIN